MPSDNRVNVPGMPVKEKRTGMGAGILRDGVLVALLAAGIAQPAIADVNDTIARCAMLEAKDDRIACLEGELRALAGSGAGAAPAIPAISGSAASRTPVAERPPPAPPVTGDVPPVATQEPTVSPAEAGDVHEMPDEPVTASATVEQAEPSPSSIDDFGSEQVESRSEAKSGDDAPVSATVVAFDVVGYKRLRVELDNGQVWRQTNGDRADVSRDLRDQQTFDVELRRTGLGGYRMHIEPIDRTIRVERLR